MKEAKEQTKKEIHPKRLILKISRTIKKEPQPSKNATIQGSTEMKKGSLWVKTSLSKTYLKTKEWSLRVLKKIHKKKLALTKIQPSYKMANSKTKINKIIIINTTKALKWMKKIVWKPIKPLPWGEVQN